MIPEFWKLLGGGHSGLTKWRKCDYYGPSNKSGGE
jgi:hypothetical protein